ncbi:MAG TPA: host attachment protein [Burkholderiales bacterium]|nr:host attachment protein [Burkholderiales bacterium]
MGTSWVLVANASSACIYLNSGPKTGLRKLKQFTHGESRKKASKLVSDRPGYNNSHGNGHGVCVPQTPPKQVEADRFALQLARELEQGRKKNLYQRLIMVAAPTFMGLLKGHLDARVRQLVTDSFEKDYTKTDDRRLKSRLERCIYL